MKKSPVTELNIEKFVGINNVDPPEKCKPGEVQTATNVDVTATGEIMLRDGTGRVYVGSPHSPFGDGDELALFREATALKRLNPGFSATIIRNDILGDLKMNYLNLNGKIYYSDEVITGITDGVVTRPWGITVPQSPTISETVGNLIAGRYLCAVTHIRDDLEESGASVSQAIDITQGGIIFGNLPVSVDPSVVYTAIYMTTCGGEALYRALIVPNGTLTATYAGDTREFVVTCSTQFLSPPPPGHILQYYNGRVYIAQDNAIWYTQPYRYGLVNLAHDFILLDSRIALFGPVQDGIWVATQTQTIFVAGKDPEDGFRMIIKADHGALEDSQQLTTELGKGGEQIRLWVWASTDGICYGGDQGMFKNLSESKHTMPGTPKRAASIIREKDEGSFYTISLIGG